MTLRGERKQEQEQKEKAYYRLERSYGSFYRRLALPEKVSSDSVKAKFADGVLEIRMPKRAAAKSSRQKISIE